MFFLGTHETSWLGRTRHPLFISRRRLAIRKRLPTALGPWALDSGGFSELSLFGRWETSPERYAAEAWRYQAEIGRLRWAAIQDWMVEPAIREKTGKSVREHQERSVQSYLDLYALAPGVPWAPVLQGWEPDDYLACADLYRSAGVDLAACPAVGVGSVCRRQGTQEALDIFAALRPLKLPLHGFGLKVGFFKRRFELGLASSDSMAWSFRARRSPPLPGCKHRSCANCFDFAMAWRDGVLAIKEQPRQLVML